jgi:PTH1 family peptidyl-tRNA hydrolase
MDQHLPSKDYFRIRLGVGRPPLATMDVAAWVLARFGADEASAVDRLVTTGADAVERLLREGLQATQNAIHPLS